MSMSPVTPAEAAKQERTDRELAAALEEIDRADKVDHDLASLGWEMRYVMESSGYSDCASLIVLHEDYLASCVRLWRGLFSTAKQERVAAHVAVVAHVAVHVCAHRRQRDTNNVLWLKPFALEPAFVVQVDFFVFYLDVEKKKIEVRGDI